MAQQVTLKLAVPEPQQQALQRHPLLRSAAERHTQQLTSIYYDTGNLALRRAGVTLRLRKNGTSWQQTVKLQDDSSGGLTARPEWHAPYLGGFDFSSIDDGMLKAWLGRAKIAGSLSAKFESNIRRSRWQIDMPTGGVVLAMLDRGWIASSGRRKSISELELQLAKGSIDDLYTTASTLSQRILLVPSLISKVEHGYRLFLDIKPAPVKAYPVALDGDASPIAAFRLIALNCLAHLQLNHAGALVGEDPEYVHQMRVATRRLRAALRMFKPVLNADFIQDLTAALRDLMVPLGRVRDFDVLMSEIVVPVARAIPEDPRLPNLASVITNRLYAAREDAAKVLSRPQYALMQLSAGALLHGEPFVAAPASTAEKQSLRHFADRRLHKLLKNTSALAALARNDEPTSLHQLRIGIKRLRYGIEFFGGLLPRNTTARLVRRLAALQDELGQLNDLASAGAVLMACAGNDAQLREAVSLVAGWHGPRYASLLAAIPDQLGELSKIKLPKLA